MMQVGSNPFNFVGYLSISMYLSMSLHLAHSILTAMARYPELKY